MDNYFKFENEVEKAEMKKFILRVLK